MRLHWLAFAAGGALFGFLAGWMLHVQATPRTGVSTQAVAQSGPPPPSSPTAPAPAALDETRVKALEAKAAADPRDAVSRAALGNLFFDAERFSEAIGWYEASLAVDPRNVDVSTDLGVCYYYTNQPDRALAQFERSLAIDPAHPKTMLNMGIVRAFGKQDLAGASAIWERLASIAPESLEGRAAKQALENLRSAHPVVGGSR
jgi:tetratricopeptide (TPR) repeat protein